MGDETMSLLEKLENDLKAAMRNKDKDTLATLRLVKGALQLEQINNKKELTDEVVVDVIMKQIKTRNESIKEFEKGNRADLVEQTKKEIALLEPYLPTQLSDDELTSIIDKVFEEVNPTGPQDMGKVMHEVTPKVKGKADMGKVSSMIKERLSCISQEKVDKKYKI